MPKTIILNPTQNSIVKIPNKGELQQIAPNCLAGIEFRHVPKIFKNYTKKIILIISKRYKFIIR